MVVAVAFNIGARQTFDYSAPDNNDNALIGKRVIAPLAGKQTAGIVMAAKRASAARRLLPLTRVLDDMPPLPKTTLQLIQFCAQYYHCPVGAAAAAVLPAMFRRISVYAPPSAYQIATSPPKESLSPTRNKARLILAVLQSGAMMTAAQIGAQVNNLSAELRRLTDEGFVNRVLLVNDKLPPENATTTKPPQLTSEQQNAIDAINIKSGFAAHLLLGATGAGKTEVYLRLAEKVAGNKKQSLILAPEIGLTPQMAQIVKARMPHLKVCVLHSGLPDGERAARWLAAARGDADIVLGTRSAVFTPMPRLGLIVVDEEHDDSYKQQDGFGFSARDVAVWRARAEKVPHLAASATPSLESYHNAVCGKYKLLRLRRRLHKPPKTELIDESQSALYHGISAQLLAAVGECAAAKKQSLLFINRRGYAPAAFCRKCKTSLQCQRCAVALTAHKRRRKLLCHWCGFSLPLDSPCAQCGGALTTPGAGTERIEEALRKRFPQAEVARLDSDAKAFAVEAAAAATGQRELLVGTQIIAKGHNFPHLSLIGILGADGGLFAPDFRARERLLATLSQVAGRGTRNPQGCRVMIQTAHPAHPFYRLLLRDDIDGCWQMLLDERKRATLPPFSHLALLRASATSEKSLYDFLTAAATLARADKPQAVSVFSPVPSLRAKIAGRYQGQLLTAAANRADLHKFITHWLPRLPKTKARWRMDIDPITV